MKSENVLEVKNLNKHFDRFSLRDISFTIPRGSIVGLIGENGTGKTTTIKTFLDIVRRDSGQVKFFGMDFDTNQYEIKDQLSVLLDDSFFNELMTPEDIAKVLELIYRDWDMKKYLNYLDRYKIPKDQQIREFSKGMKRKLSIAVALSHKAKFLILDEPTSALDPIIREEILEELLDFMQDEERAILFSTHITSDLDKIADYIIFIHEGRIILSGDRESLLTNYGILKVAKDQASEVSSSDYIKKRRGKFSHEFLVTNRFEAQDKYEEFLVDPVNIEDIMLFFIKGE